MNVVDHILLLSGVFLFEDPVSRSLPLFFLFCCFFFSYLFNFLVICGCYIFWTPVYYRSCELDVCDLPFNFVYGVIYCMELKIFTVAKCINLFLFGLFLFHPVLQIFPCANIIKILSSRFFFFFLNLKL